MAEKNATIYQSDDQEKWLADAMNVVKQQGFYMKRALDSSNLKEALKYSSQMLGELRTSKLSPQKYYELYVRVFDALRHLEIFFESENRKGKACSDFYEIVQHAGNVLPRLYLLCTVGSVYIKSKEAPAKEVLKDLVEMCRGVQHPIRGLFLRNYLTQLSKDKLPDTGSEYQGDGGGDVNDAVEFLLQNFTEMNKLWVRMAKNQGPSSPEKEKREKERSELRDLVGKNLHVLSQLEGVDLDMYKTVVLPRILEQIVNCKDEIAQYYLMDCVIQVFPDEFHLHTLETVLDACPQLLPSVDIKTIMSGLMDRLSNFVHRSPEVLPDLVQVDAFPKLSSAVQKVLEANPTMAVLSLVNLHSALLNFVLQVHSQRLDYVDTVLASCARSLDGKSGGLDSASTKQLVALLTSPLEKYSNVLTVLSLPHYLSVMTHLDYKTNKVMATVIVQSLLKTNTTVSDPEQVELLFHLLGELIHDTDGIPPADELDADDFGDEQNLVARLVHLLVNKDPTIQLKILQVAESHFRTGGSFRLVFTVPPTVFCTLKLVRLFLSEDLDPLKIFQFLISAIEPLSSVAPQLSLRLYLQCAEAASECGLEDVAYDLFTQAFVIYEEDIADSKAQITALHLIIGTLQRCHSFGEENWDALTHKSTAYSAKLLKKEDQCRAVYTCSHLFWNSESGRGVQDGERVLLCLKRAQKIANAAQQVSAASGRSSHALSLFVEILNKYLYFLDKGVPEVTVGPIQSLLEAISFESHSEFAMVEQGAEAVYKNTLSYIEGQKSMQDGPQSHQYALIQL